MVRIDEATPRLRAFLVSLYLFLMTDGGKTVMSGPAFQQGKPGGSFSPSSSVSCFYFFRFPPQAAEGGSCLLQTYDFFTGESFSSLVGAPFS